MTAERDPEIRWLKAALQDLSEIVDYVAKDSPQSAARLAEGIFAKVDLLKNAPRLGAVCPHYRKARQLIHGQYIIYYTAHRGRVVIRAVAHGARLFRSYWLERED